MCESVRCTVCRSPAQSPRPPSGIVAKRLLRRTVARPAVLAAVALLLSGCIVRHYPTDLQVELRGVVARDDILRIVGPEPWPRLDTAILLDLSSSEDWVGRANRYPASTQLEGGFCDGRRVPLLTYYSLYANGNLAGHRLPSGEWNIPPPDDDGRYVFQGFLQIRYSGEGVGYPGNDENDYWGPFDLEREPRDVCLYVGGGSPLALPRYYYRSNVVEIGKAEIEAVLRSAREVEED